MFAATLLSLQYNNNKISKNIQNMAYSTQSGSEGEDSYLLTSWTLKMKLLNIKECQCLLYCDYVLL